jgi:hypothetical protein
MRAAQVLIVAVVLLIGPGCSGKPSADKSKPKEDPASRAGTQHDAVAEKDADAKPQIQTASADEPVPSPDKGDEGEDTPDTPAEKPSPASATTAGPFHSFSGRV